MAQVGGTNAEKRFKPRSAPRKCELLYLCHMSDKQGEVLDEQDEMENKSYLP